MVSPNNQGLDDTSSRNRIKMENKYVVMDIESMGLNAWLGDKVTCICAKDSDGETFSACLKGCNGEESIMLDLFFGWFYSRKDFLVVSHSGKGFDVPFLCARAVINGLPIPKNLLQAKHFDLQDIANYRISLNNMAKLFKCEMKNGTGLEAIKLYEQCRWRELMEYCMQDVKVTEQVYLKQKELK